MKDILIIGGMGPQASLLLHKRIIDHAVKQGARHEHEFPSITHVSIAVKDFISDKQAVRHTLRHIRRNLGYLWLA